MFGKRFELFKLFGFAVRLDASWIILAVLITWSLATGLFPAYYENFDPAVYWWMGAIGTLGLFASIVFHEMSHSLVARRFGMPMKGITLFIFGGVAEMEEEPPTPRAEFWTAVAGPLASGVLVFFFWLLSAAGPEVNWSIPVSGVFEYLAGINGLLIAFNSIPAFPLDGGRVLRSALWKWKGDLRRATQITSRLGSAFGVLLVIMGAFSFLSGNFIGGLWWVLIGLFLRGAAGMSYQRLVVRQALEGESVRRFMAPEPVSVPPEISVEKLVDDYIYRYHFKMLPVVENGKLVGCISTRQVREVPRAEWGERTAAELAESCSGDNSISPDADATRALAQMNRTGLSRLMVVEGDRLVGVIALKDLLRFLSLKLELEGDDESGLGLEQLELEESEEQRASLRR